ncbi:DapH/DapD/GlmU-related protein [Synechococcus sp. A10-1-5-1]|uniref:acyltransferase n=1 Tax=Synechococcus sp. A10-1-5-1 TaxID=2936507 RepID=UPI00353055EE
MIDRGCIISSGAELSGNVLHGKEVGLYNQLGAVHIGDNVHICQHCILMGYGGISIGDNCVLSACTKLYSLSSLHVNPNDKAAVISVYPYEKGYFRLGKISIGFNTWIGLNCIVMPGVDIGENTFCVSNSVVTRDLASNSYATGHPAHAIGLRFQESPS